MLNPRRLDNTFTFPASASVLKELRRLVEVLEGRLTAVESAEAAQRQSLLDATNALFDATGAAIVPAIGGILRMQQRGFMTAHSATELQLTTNWPVSLTITDDDERIGWVASPYIGLTRDADVNDFAIVRTDAYDHETGFYAGQIVQAFGPHQGTSFDDWTLTGLPGPVIAERQMWAEVTTAAAQVSADLVAAETASATAVAYGADAELAHQWATKPTTAVAGGEFSAYYWAQRALTAAGFVDGTAYAAVDGSRPFTGKQSFAAPIVGRASARFPHGTTPTTLVDGDLWTETAGLFVRLNGATRRHLTTVDAATYELATNKGAANGYTPLGADQKVPVAYLPSIGLVSVVEVATQAAMLALTAQAGDVAVRTDESKTYMLGGTGAPGTLANWIYLRDAAAPVQSVAGLAGAITAAGLKTALGLDTVDNTTDLGKPVSLLQQAALDAKSDVVRVPLSVTTATYTFVLLDRARPVLFNSATAQTATIPPDSSVAYAVGTQIDLLRLGAGIPSIAPGAGVTLVSDGNKRTLGTRYQGGMLLKIAANSWVLSGTIAA